MEDPKKEKKDEEVTTPSLPAKLYVTEASGSAKRVEQERVCPDPDDSTFAKLLEDSKDAPK